MSPDVRVYTESVQYSTLNGSDRLGMVNLGLDGIVPSSYVL